MQHIPYLTPQTENKFTVPLPDDPKGVPTEDFARARALKYDFAMGARSPGSEAFYARIVNGDDTALRNRLASEQTLEIQQEKARWIDELSRAQEGPLSEEQFQFVQGLSGNDMVDPNTVFEKEYAKRLFSTLFPVTPETEDENDDPLGVINSTLYTRALQEDPAKTDTLLQVGEDITAKHEVVTRRMEEQQTLIKNKPWAYGSRSQDEIEQGSGYLEDLIEQFVPFKNWYDISTTLDDIPEAKEAGGFLMGNSMSDKIEWLWSRPVSEFHTLFNQTFDALNKKNSITAQRFAAAVDGFSQEDKSWANIESLLDISSLIPFGSAAKFVKGARALPQFSSAVRRAVKTATKKPVLNITETLASVGKVDQAARVQVLKNLTIPIKPKATLTKKDQLQQLDVVLSRTPSFMDPLSFLSGGTKIVGGRLRWLEERLIASSELANKAAVDLQTLERLNEFQKAQAIQNTVKNFEFEIGQTNNTIADIENLWIPAEKTFGNVDTVKFNLTKPDGTLFETEDQAFVWADDVLKLGDFKIRDYGEGYSIETYRTVDETAPSIRDQVITTGNVNPQNTAESYLGIARSAEYNLPEDNLANRERLIHGMQAVFKQHEDLLKPVRALRSGSKKRFTRFATLMRDMARREDTEKRGDFFRTLGEFETAWQSAFNRVPTAKEASAWFSYLTYYDLDYAVRNFSIYGDLARQGINLFQPVFAGAKNVPFTEGRLVAWNEFNLDNLSGRAGFVIDDQFVTKAEILDNKVLRENFVDLQDAGFKIYQIANPLSRPFKDALDNGNVINFVMSKEVRVKPLPIDQIPYEPGGHVIYDYRYKIAQPRLQNIRGRQTFTHDTTIRMATTEKLGRKAANLYDEARKLYLASLSSKNPRVWTPLRKEFNTFVEKNLPESPATLRKMFEKGELSTTEPIRMLRSGSRSIDEATVRNELGDIDDYGSDPLNLMRTVNKEYARERGFNLSGIVENIGTENKPLLGLEAAKLLDPLSTIERASASMTRSVFFDDYRTMSAEYFVNRFWPVMRESREKLSQNPFAALYNPKWNERVRDQEMLRQAVTYQKSVLRLMEVRTATQRAMAGVKEKLYNSLFDSFGEKTAEFIDDHLLWRLEDPLKFMRSAAMHLKIGMFVPRQFLQQSMTLAHMLPLAGDPIVAEKAMFGYNMRFLLLSNETPRVMKGMTKAAKAFGWKEDEFLEAYDFLKRSGMAIIEGDHILRESLSSQTIFGNKMGKWLSKASLAPWKEGERLTRIVAHNLAYLEWRKANPDKTLNRYAELAIGRRREVFTVNMTRASEANWQRGLLTAPPAQFLTYQLRLFEQFTGKKLTSKEKARIFLTYATLYGVPIAATGSFLPFAPFYDDIREERLAEGKDFDNVAAETMHRGIVSMMMEMITGDKIDFGESMGPRGVTLFQDIMSSDKSFMDIMLGAGGNVVGESFTSLYPAFYSLRALFTEGAGPGQLKVFATDMGDFAKNISSVNSAYKMYYGLKFGTRVAKSEIVIDDITPFETTMLSVFGMQPERFLDMSAIIKSMGSAEKTGADEYAKEQIIKYLRRWMKAETEEERLAYLKQAQIWRLVGDLRPDEYGDILRDALSGHEHLIDKINRSFFVDNSPQSQRDARFRYYQTHIGNK